MAISRILAAGALALVPVSAFGLERNEPLPVQLIGAEEINKTFKDIPGNNFFFVPATRTNGTANISIRGLGAVTGVRRATGSTLSFQTQGTLSYGLPVGDNLLTVGAYTRIRYLNNFSQFDVRPYARFDFGNSSIWAGYVENSAFAVQPQRKIDLFAPDLPNIVFDDNLRIDHDFGRTEVSASINFNRTYANLGVGHSFDENTYLHAGIEYNLNFNQITYTNIGLVHQRNDRTTLGLDYTRRGTVNSFRATGDFVLYDFRNSFADLEPPASSRGGDGMLSAHLFAEANSSGRQGIGAGLSWSPFDMLSLGFGIEALSTDPTTTADDDLLAIFSVRRSF